MSVFSDTEISVSAYVSDLETMVQRFIELFDENDGEPILTADTEEITDTINDATYLLEADYSTEEF